LLSAYAIFRRESGPIISDITPEEMDAWVELLAKGASRAPLVRCSSEALTDLILYLVSKLKQASSTATSFAGSQPDVSSIQNPPSEVIPDAS
jgi:hypothetical protein